MGRKTERVAAFLFPPNWSSCTAAPHLALPLLAGVADRRGWFAECYDLTVAFARQYTTPPAREAVVSASLRGDWTSLDAAYFQWEDQFQSLSHYGATPPFGLLSGYCDADLGVMPLSEAASRIGRDGTVYSRFYTECLVPQLLQSKPSVVAITIASRHQIVAAVDLLQTVRAALPGTLLVLGGNVVTRLRNTHAMPTFCALADHVVLYQGENAFNELLSSVESLGVIGARASCPAMSGDQLIPFADWPIPSFGGIVLDDFVGLPALPYVSTRGCYWGKCNFCAIPAGWAESGYAGSSHATFAATQIQTMCAEAGVYRVKLVDEALAPSKARRLAAAISCTGQQIEWEAYARLERAWEKDDLLFDAHAAGLRKLYFGLEQSPVTNRSILNKNDHGDILVILEACRRAGVKVHLFCMVGHPGSSESDAAATTEFLIANRALVDTADLVGFRLDRGTEVRGVRPISTTRCDWLMSFEYEPTDDGILGSAAVAELEATCQELVWQRAPRLLHPLYRLVGPWSCTNVEPVRTSRTSVFCSALDR